MQPMTLYQYESLCKLDPLFVIGKERHSRMKISWHFVQGQSITDGGAIRSFTPVNNPNSLHIAALPLSVSAFFF